ncbi:hypothetical protein SUGI_0432280 [Cryptomeria japonica]|nr:hypothetical protein SUGI_0432280 [Cryptomeria japonica]
MMKESAAPIGEATPNSKTQNCSITVTVCSSPEIDGGQDKDYQNRAQWLRAAVLGANDGLVTTASLMMGVGAVKTDSKTMVMSGIAALVAGACSMAIGEFVSVQTQREAELSNLKEEKEGLPCPIQAACASAVSFSAGALFPLISTAFITDYVIRVGVLARVSSLALTMFGAIGAYFGRSSLVKGSVRILMGGWLAMLVTYGLLRFFNATAGI